MALINNMSDFMGLPFDVIFRETDGFVNGTALAKAGGKLMNQYNRSKRAQRFKAAFHRRYGTETKVIQDICFVVPMLKFLRTRISSCVFCTYLHVR